MRKPAQQKPSFTVGTRSGSSSKPASLAFFVRFSLPGDGQEASFCSRKVSAEGRADFGESEVATVSCSPALLDLWWTSSLSFSVHCRSLGQRTPLLLGTASLGLKHLLASQDSLEGGGLSLALPVYSAQGLARSLGVARGEAREIVANISVTLKFGMVEGGRKERVAKPQSPRKAEREGEVSGRGEERMVGREEGQDRVVGREEGEEVLVMEEGEVLDVVERNGEVVDNDKREGAVTLHSLQPSQLPISLPVHSLLVARPGASLPTPCTLRHRSWSGREVQGAVLRCQELLLSPGEEARLANRQLLSRLVANYLVIEVWGEGGQLAGLARLPTSPLHQGLAAGQPERLVVALDGLVEVVGVQEGEVVGLLEVGLWAGTLEQLEEVGGGVRSPGVDRQTMTCCEEETQPTHLYDTPASETEELELSRDLEEQSRELEELDTVREKTPRSLGKADGEMVERSGLIKLQVVGRRGVWEYRKLLDLAYC